MNFKKAAAEKAVDGCIANGMLVGLGTGSTASYAIKYIGQLVDEKKLSDIECVATSNDSAELAQKCGLKVLDFNSITKEIDVTIDGADEIDGHLTLIKGRGGALFREKMVELATKKFVVIADDSKIVDKLGDKCPIPVEVVQFGHPQTAKRIKQAFPQSNPVLRLDQPNKPFITDNQNYIYDITGLDLTDVNITASKLKNIMGVVEHGIFIGMASLAYIAHKDGVQLMKK